MTVPTVAPKAGSAAFHVREEAVDEVGRVAVMHHIHQLAALGIDQGIFRSPNFEWGRELDDIVDDVHHIAPNRSGR